MVTPCSLSLPPSIFTLHQSPIHSLHAPHLGGSAQGRGVLGRKHVELELRTAAGGEAGHTHLIARFEPSRPSGRACGWAGGRAGGYGFGRRPGVSVGAITEYVRVCAAMRACERVRPFRGDSLAGSSAGCSVGILRVRSCAFVCVGILRSDCTLRTEFP
jgi:hypothetical protein